MSCCTHPSLFCTPGLAPEQEQKRQLAVGRCTLGTPSPGSKSPEWQGSPCHLLLFPPQPTHLCSLQPLKPQPLPPAFPVSVSQQWLSCFNSAASLSACGNHFASLRLSFTLYALLNAHVTSRESKVHNMYHINTLNLHYCMPIISQ